MTGTWEQISTLPIIPEFTIEFSLLFSEDIETFHPIILPGYETIRLRKLRLVVGG